MKKILIVAILGVFQSAHAVEQEDFFKVTLSGRACVEDVNGEGEFSETREFRSVWFSDELVFNVGSPKNFFKGNLELELHDNYYGTREIRRDRNYKVGIMSGLYRDTIIKNVPAWSDNHSENMKKALKLVYKIVQKNSLIAIEFNCQNGWEGITYSIRKLVYRGEDGRPVSL